MAPRAIEDGINDIFFASSNTQTFSSDAARCAFRQRWLGRYLDCDPDLCFVALDRDGRIAGYIVGALDDPAASGRFSDIWYFANFATLTRRFPAHLHVNLAPVFRNQGVGSALVSRFVSQVSAAGVPGVHVVTSEGARNIGFYARNGFQQVGQAERDGARVVFLGREVAHG
ncbi:MAG: GNAT family N-acetyltransferase [Hyphomicrobiaceae bacterium]|nr:GNAT family N-acetyltransferase [Hyphomicrobiaceae bacterium]